MTRRIHMLFLALLATIAICGSRNEHIRRVATYPELRQERQELEARFTHLSTLKPAKEATRARLEDLRAQLAETSRAFLPDPADPYAWSHQRLAYLASSAGVQLHRTTEERPPPLREPRGTRNRRFKIYRLRAELTAPLDGLVQFLEAATTRNRFLTISELYVGPTRSEHGDRDAVVQFDWPIRSPLPTQEAGAKGRL